ncbi:MAG: hypothetical protein WCI18_05115 [Pseudomonadota bacterium]
MRIDYETFKEIEPELLRPILGDGLDYETLRKLYESKIVYLSHLRSRCFKEINQNMSPDFKPDDLATIVRALTLTQEHVRLLVLTAMQESLAKRRA